MQLTQDQRRELELVNDEDRWPHWPVLPVKRHREGDMPDLGVIVAGRSTVYLVNLFQLRAGPLGPQLEGVERKHYADREALIADGWVGD